MVRTFDLDLLVEAYGARRGGGLSAAELQEELRTSIPDRLVAAGLFGAGQARTSPPLIRHIIEEATGEPAQTQVWGPN